MRSLVDLLGIGVISTRDRNVFRRLVSAISYWIVKLPIVSKARPQPNNEGLNIKGRILREVSLNVPLFYGDT